jgi:hypothetical protein
LDELIRYIEDKNWNVNEVLYNSEDRIGYVQYIKNYHISYCFIRIRISLPLWEEFDCELLIREIIYELYGWRDFKLIMQ